jgi:UPF0755 protein
MRRASRILLSLVIAAALIVGGVVFWGYGTFRRPGSLAQEKVVVIPRGAGLRAIAASLKAAGVIDHPLVFVAAARLTEGHRDLKAGEFAFPPGISPADALAQIRAGRVVIRHITIPEGLTSVQIAELLAATDGLVHDLKQPPPEGSLLPETYDFVLDDQSTAIVARMTAAQRGKLDTLWQNRQAGLPLATPGEAVILASIVEKETGVADERSRIAAVFVNRLNLGMRLQSDPTVIYALSGGAGPLGRKLTRADLDTDSPYNTYKAVGLPPTPIANPGEAAIAAVLNPMSTKDLYFVADGTGGHAFAETLREHNRNVAKWRRLQRQANPPATNGN